MKTLTSRDRFLRSIERRDIDRIPLFYRAEPSVDEKVRNQLGLASSANLLDYFGADSMGVPVIRSRKYYGTEPDNDGCWLDLFGNKHKTVQYGELSSSAVVMPVLDGSVNADDIDAKVHWPGIDFVDISQSRKAAMAARATGRAVYGGMWASLFTVSRSMMGEEHFLVSTIENPAFVERLVGRLADFYLACNEAYFNACRESIDVFYFGSDFGTQASMFLSANAFRRFFQQPMKRLCDQAKGFGLKVMYHTCGAVGPIIPDLIDIGVDILDPVQVSAAGMGAEELSHEFKGRIAFHGGISTQTTLPFGTPDDVREETVLAIEAFGPLAYVAAPDQELIGDVPVENIVAMVETIKNYRF